MTRRAGLVAALALVVTALAGTAGAAEPPFHSTVHELSPTLQKTAHRHVLEAGMPGDALRPATVSPSALGLRGQAAHGAAHRPRRVRRPASNRLSASLRREVRDPLPAARHLPPARPIAGERRRQRLLRVPPVGALAVRRRNGEHGRTMRTGWRSTSTHARTRTSGCGKRARRDATVVPRPLADPRRG